MEISLSTSAAAPSASEPAGQADAPQPDSAAATDFGAPADGAPPPDIRNALPPAEPGVMAQLTPSADNGPEAQPAATPSTESTAPQGALAVDSDTNTVDTGNYTVHASQDNGGTVTVTDNASGEEVKVWGDGQIETSDGDKTSFMDQPATFELPDGTKITVTPTEGEGHIDNVTITRGNDAVQISGVHDGNLHTEALPGQGRSLDGATPDGTVLQAKGGRIADWVLPGGTEVKDNNVQNIDGYANAVPSAAGSVSAPGLDKANNRFVTKEGNYVDLNTNRLHYKNGIVTEPLSQTKLNYIMEITRHPDTIRYSVSTGGSGYYDDGSGKTSAGLDKANNRYVMDDGSYIDLNTNQLYYTDGDASDPLPQARVNNLIALAKGQSTALADSLTAQYNRDGYGGGLNPSDSDGVAFGPSRGGAKPVSKSWFDESSNRLFYNGGYIDYNTGIRHWDDGSTEIESQFNLDKWKTELLDQEEYKRKYGLPGYNIPI